MAQDIEERRLSLLQATLLGFEEDLDDLRDQLSRELNAYEGRLDVAVSGIPAWLALEPGWVRDWFQFDVDGSMALLGPRSVALAASHLESLVQSMFGPHGGPYAWPEEDDFRAQSIQLRAQFDGMEERARACALDIEENLSETLDEIIADLESKRERDERALRELISAGDLDRGEDTQREIADLWEDQRTRTREIRKVWEPLERLAFEGIHSVGEGLLQLRELLAHLESLVLGVSEEKTSRVDASDEPPRITEALPRQESTDEWERDSVGEDEVSNPESDWGVTDPDVPGPTAPLSFADVPKDTDERVVEPDVAEVEDEVEVVRGSLMATGFESTKASAKKSKSPEPKPSKEVAVVRGVASRVVDEWQPVSVGEKILVAGPFVVFSMVFGVMSGMALAGSSMPLLHAWWVFPWGFLAVVTWFVIGAILRHWRLDWPLRLVEWAEFEEDVTVEISPGHVKVGSTTVDRQKLRVSRWQSDAQHVGWIVAGPGVSMFGEERDYSRWSASKLPVEPLRAEMWEVQDGLLEGFLQGQT